VQFPRIAYILLWFPKPSETFIFAEVMNLWKMGVPLKVFTLYGEWRKDLSPEMVEVSDRVERLGTRYLKSCLSDITYWRKRKANLRSIIFGSRSPLRWGGLEKTGENIWATLSAFCLARRFQEEGIQHIHAPWASGPATAAWIASRLTGIPFSFSARAWDIHPPDGCLADKLRDATFVRSETSYNINHLAGFIGGDTSKLHCIYNGVPLQPKQEAPVHMEPPYKLLALGRFVGKKGYEYLLQACKTLKDSQIDFRLTLAGDGPLRTKLTRLTRSLGLEDNVSFPGFVSHEHVSELFMETDMLLMPSVVHSSGDRDGIPTVIMESLMHRVPVVATDVAGISEVIEDGETGILIPEKNSQAIADAVTRMAKDRSIALGMAETGRDRVRKQFDPEASHQQMLDLLTKHAAPSEPTQS
jgi:colanic acid/amylovoran biosynthesis glycosyltransferase